MDGSPGGLLIIIKIIHDKIYLIVTLILMMTQMTILMMMSKSRMMAKVGDFLEIFPFSNVWPAT